MARVLIVIGILLLSGCSFGKFTPFSEAQAMAEAEAKRSAPHWLVPARLARDGRPSEAFVMGALSNIDEEKAVCEAVLNSLNKASTPRENHQDSTSPFGIAEILLQNDYSIEWTYIGNDGMVSKDQIADLSSRAVVDIDNDGDDDTVYRDVRLVGASTVIFLSGYEGYPPSSEGPHRLSHSSRITRMDENDSVADNGVIYARAYKLDQSSISDDYRIDLQQGFSQFQRGQYLDVLTMDGVSYILLGGSTDAAISWHPVPIRLYRAKTYREHKFVCSFVPIDPKKQLNK